jgi:hypothetical protein
MRLQRVDGKFAAKPDCELPKLIDCPASMDGIERVLRTSGPKGIPVKVRAWLACILPPHHADALGIGRGLPISAIKAAEAIRMKRDPRAGNRMEYFSRIAQRQADERARAARNRPVNRR